MDYYRNLTSMYNTVTRENTFHKDKKLFEYSSPFYLISQETRVVGYTSSVSSIPFW